MKKSLQDSLSSFNVRQNRIIKSFCGLLRKISTLDSSNLLCAPLKQKLKLQKLKPKRKNFSAFKPFLTAFSLIELMISLIVVSCITAAFTPVITKKLKASGVSAGSLGDSLRSLKGSNECLLAGIGGGNCKLCYISPSNPAKNKCYSCSNPCTSAQYQNTDDCSCINCNRAVNATPRGFGANCQACNAAGCLRCSNGMQLVNRQCQTCPANRVCDGSGNVRLPSEGKRAVNGIEQDCPTGTWSFPNSNNFTCSTSNCGTGFYCNNPGVNQGSRTQCEAGYRCVDGIRYACGAGTAQPNRGQTSCNNCGAGTYSSGSVNTSCTSCWSGSYSIGTQNSSCQSCSNYSTGCTTCTASSGYCNQCGNNSTYYLYSGRCYTCPSNATCNGTTTITCSSGYYLYGSGSNQSCKLCSSAMSNCSTCSSSTWCTGCISSAYYLYNGSCYSCPSYGTCNGSSITCASGRYKSGSGSSVSCPTCSSAMSGCSTCSSSSWCNSCSSSSWYLSSGKCYTCSSAMSGCSTCSSSSWCTSCQTGWSLSSGRCNYVTCSSGQYKSGSSCYSCSSAITNCSTCSSASSCTTCKSGYWKYSSTSCKQCEEGYWCNGTSRYSCGTGKTSPVGSSSSSACQTKTCPTGQFLWGDSCDTCSTYNSNCTACTTWNQCTSCASGYGLIDGYCYETCSSVASRVCAGQEGWVDGDNGISRCYMINYYLWGGISWSESEHKASFTCRSTTYSRCESSNWWIDWSNWDWTWNYCYW